jgi:hypothetical protein
MNRIQQMFLLLLSAGILFQQGSKSFIVLDYLLNKKYIASVLCENKNKPQMHCNGKCHMRKQLQAAEKKEGNEKQNLNEKQEMPWWENNTGTKICFERKPGKSIKMSTPGEKNYSVTLTSLFRPPCV